MPQRPMASGTDVQVWMQQIEDRLARLEGKRTVSVGGWVLAERGGRVELRNARSGRVVVLADDDAGEGNGDEGEGAGAR